MQIRYERPLPDLRYLVNAPLRLDLGEGRITRIDRWCPEGLVPPPNLEGDGGEARVIVPFHQFEIGFRVKLKRDRDVNLMRFVDLGARETRVISHFYREIVTGRAVSDGAIIASMDTPVDLIPMERTPKEMKQERPAFLPRFLRIGVVLCLYAALAYLIYEPLILPIYEGVQNALAISAERTVAAVELAPVSQTEAPSEVPLETNNASPDDPVAAPLPGRLAPIQSPVQTPVQELAPQAGLPLLP